MTHTKADAIQRARTFLFVPGDRPDRYAKAAAAGADIVIVDLEDAVAAAAKDEARRAAADWLRAGGRACVRINAGSAADLAAIADAPGLIAVMVPKATPDIAPLGVPVIALVETAAGMARAGEIAAAPGVARLAFGHLDYALDIGAATTRTAMLAARSALVLASRAAGLPGPVDGVTADLADGDALTGDVRYARELGFTGKLLIHPAQVAPAHAALAPTAAEIAWAERIVAGATPGASNVAGEMIDAPVLARAELILGGSDG